MLVSSRSREAAAISGSTKPTANSQFGTIDHIDPGKARRYPDIAGDQRAEHGSGLIDPPPKPAE